MTEPLGPGREGGGRWSLRLGTLLGIPIRMHVTFALLIGWFLVWAASTGQNVLLWLILLGLVSLCVVAHEMGHAIAARRYGLETREIVLHPIGGLARLEGIPSGAAEVVIALAGPAVNLVLTLVFLVAVVAVGLPFQVGSQSSLLGSALIALFYANLLLFLFNLVPAFPMDGGRALRGMLTIFSGEERATRIATAIGQALALACALFAMIGPLPDVMLRLILLMMAFFVLAGANREMLVQRTRRRVRGRSAREAMMTRFESLQPQDTLEWAARLMLATHQRDFPVVDAWGRLAGLLDRGTLLAGLSRVGKESAVLESMDRDPPVVGPSASLDDALQRLQRGRAVLVAEEGELLGMITAEKVAQLIEVLEHVYPGPPAATG